MARRRCSASAPLLRTRSQGRSREPTLSHHSRQPARWGRSSGGADFRSTAVAPGRSDAAGCHHAGRANTEGEMKKFDAWFVAGFGVAAPAGSGRCRPAAQCMTAGGWGIGVFEGFASFMAEAAMKNSAKAVWAPTAPRSATYTQKCEWKTVNFECHATRAGLQVGCRGEPLRAVTRAFQTAPASEPARGFGHVARSCRHSRSARSGCRARHRNRRPAWRRCRSRSSIALVKATLSAVKSPTST